MGLVAGMMTMLYLIVSIVIFVIYANFTSNKLRKILLLAFLILLPTWDVLVQKGIKTFHQTFLMEPIIYAYPERDENNKIESLGLVDVSYGIFDYIGDEKINSKKIIYGMYGNIIQDVSIFIEISGGKRIYKKKRRFEEYLVRIELDKISEIKSIKKIEEQTARYQIKATPFEDKLLGFYKTRKFSLIDTKTDKLLAESKMIYYSNHKWYAWFRDILYHKSLFGRPISTMSVSSINSLDEMTKKVFNMRVSTDENKGIKYD